MRTQNLPGVLRCAAACQKTEVLNAMREKIWTRDFTLTFLSLFFCSMVMYMLMTTLTEHAAALGANASVGGLVSGIYVVGGLFARFYSGAALERTGWKKLTAAALAVHLAACIVYFFVNSLTELILLRFIHGVSFGIGATAIITIGMSLIPKSRYGEATGYFMLAPTLAIAAGPFGGGVMYDYFGAPGCFAAASAMSLLLLLLILPINLNGAEPQKNTTKTADSPFRGIARFIEVKAVPVSMCIFLLAFGYAAVMSFYRLYAAETGLTSEFSAFFIIYGAVLLLSRPLAGRLQDCFGDTVICITGIVLQALGLFSIAWRPGTLAVILCAVGCALGYGTLGSCFSAIVCRNAPPERRSYAVATFWVFCDGGMGLGPAVLGMAAAAAGFSGMYCAAATISLAALPIYCLTRRKRG